MNEWNEKKENKLKERKKNGKRNFIESNEREESREKVLLQIKVKWNNKNN